MKKYMCVIVAVCVSSACTGTDILGTGQGVDPLKSQDTDTQTVQQCGGIAGILCPDANGRNPTPSLGARLAPAYGFRNRKPIEIR